MALTNMYIINRTLISISPKPYLLLREKKLCISISTQPPPPPTPTVLSSFSISARRIILALKCTANDSNGGGGLKEALAGVVDSRVEEILNREENKSLLDGLEKATERVERAKRDLAESERQELEAKHMRDYITRLESRTSEIAECQREISKAKAMMEEAQRSLSNEDAKIGKNEERVESAKAAFISALVGTLAALPISLSQVSDNSQLILPSVVTFISCALFGVTYRYVIRRDLDDFHLKSGAAAAFGVVKGLATVDGGPPLELEAESIFSHAVSGAVYVTESLLLFLFAAAALDFCYRLRVLSPFPIQKQDSETEKR